MPNMLPKTLPTFALLAVAVSTAHAEPPTLEIPAEISPLNGYAIVEPKTTAKAITYLGLSGVYPFPTRLLADKLTFVLPTQGLAAGRYQFIAVGSLNDEHVTATFAVTIGTPPVPPTPPGPGPGPTPPNPPGPVDPLTKRVLDALASDPGTVAEKAKYAAALSGFYAAMAKHVASDQAATVGDLLSDYRAAIPAVLPEGVIPATRKVCGKEVAAVVGEDAERKIDATLKAELVGLFGKLAAALEVK